MEQFDRMKIVVVAGLLSVALPLSVVAQAGPDKVGQAYAQFLLGHHLEEAEDVEGAIAAYKRAIALDPSAAEAIAELAGLYLRQNRIQEALTTAEQALRVAPANAEANRVMGIVHAALAETGSRGGRSGPRTADAPAADEHVAKALSHLELSIANLKGEPDPNVRAMLARLYIRNGTFDKAIPLLSALVEQEPEWGDGPGLLAEAYAGAGRHADAIKWLEGKDDPRLLWTLADFYERERRWKDAANTYERVLQRPSRNTDVRELKTRYASALLNAGARADAGKARDVLSEIVSANATDARALYLRSQAARRLGDTGAAEADARRVIALNKRSPWGYYALAEALEQAHKYQMVIDELGPVVAASRSTAGDASIDIELLLPHLGFAHQQLGRHEEALAAFEEARRLSPKDPAVAGYLIEANIAAKKYSSAVEVARAALAEHPDDLRLTRLQAQALRHSGRADQGVALMEEALKKHADKPAAYIGLAQIYTDADRGAQAVKVLREAQAKFPTDNAIVFELGAVYDKQKNFPDAEAAFKQLLSRDSENAPALNYLGYMLAERGERLDESVSLLQKALQIDPENGSYLDSLGWAYFKAEKLDLAEANLRRAADQLKTNSVIQDHYGDVLFKLGRYHEAIAAWTRALAGDGDSISRANIDKKIRDAKQKLNKP
jgi:tetratricopeptide (TPR) repeat protein